MDWAKHLWWGECTQIDWVSKAHLLVTQPLEKGERAQITDTTSRHSPTFEVWAVEDRRRRRRSRRQGTARHPWATQRPFLVAFFLCYLHFSASEQWVSMFLALGITTPSNSKWQSAFAFIDWLFVSSALTKMYIRILNTQSKNIQMMGFNDSIMAIS